MQSDQLSPIGADMTSASSLSLSIYNILLYGEKKTGLSSVGSLSNFGVNLAFTHVEMKVTSPSADLFISHGLSTCVTKEKFAKLFLIIYHGR